MKLFIWRFDDDKLRENEINLHNKMELYVIVTIEFINMEFALWSKASLYSKITFTRFVLFEPARHLFLAAAHMRNTQTIRISWRFTQKTFKKVCADVSLKFVNLIRSDRVEIVECFTYRRHFSLSSFWQCWMLEHCSKIIEFNFKGDDDGLMRIGEDLIFALRIADRQTHKV